MLGGAPYQYPSLTGTNRAELIGRSARAPGFSVGAIFGLMTIWLLSPLTPVGQSTALLFRFRAASKSSESEGA
jgi:hypothetical protein